MKKIFYIFIILLCANSIWCSDALAQVPKRNPITATDLDGDGVSDMSGQDKCPTTLTQIQGQRATTINEISGKEVRVRLPEKLPDYLFQDRIPLDEELKKLLNKQGEYKRELKRIDEKFGKYDKMKSAQRKEEKVKYDSLNADMQTKIVEIQDKIKKVDPNSYIEFVGNVEDKDGKITEQQVKVRIRLSVDSFGCLPDDDKDGSPNMVDECPTFVGSVETGGCPDRDKDGVPDHSDRCPDVKGKKESRGCPDRDGDFIPDIDDECPDTKGLLELAGCPDKDGDGIADKNDDCPDVKGLKEFKGCPDRDGDGIQDKEDDCPDVKGLKEFKGCPDRDGDGIQDKEDKCPDEKGTKETQGCPDKDGDGTMDKDDDCPSVPGPKDNKGCPKILEKASKVQFEPGKSVILKASYPLLDELAKLLKEFTDANIAMSGHTDSDGDDASNLQLSKDRAQAVAEYLIGKGIESSRITHTGFGETKPIADNNTPEGKAKNRRVEMKLSNRK